jgi:protein MpaA
MRRRRTAAAVPLAAVFAVVACGGGSQERDALVTSVAPTTRAAVTLPADAASTTTTSVTQATSTTSAPTAATTTSTLAPDARQQVEIGRSVEGRPIVAVERGTPGGTTVLVIGVIHGDETAGAEIVEELATRPVPEGVDLWLVPSANPDGQANGTRTNAHQVDLNRNFPFRWAPLDEPGGDEYAGPSAASEPETQAIVNLVRVLRPDLAVWYHQDLFRISPGRGRAGRVRERYAELTGLPMAPVTGGTYTGTAATWEQRTVPNGVAFIVELGPTLSGAEAGTHADAVLELARA